MKDIINLLSITKSTILNPELQFDNGDVVDVLVHLSGNEVLFTRMRVQQIRFNAMSEKFQIQLSRLTSNTSDEIKTVVSSGEIRLDKKLYSKYGKSMLKALHKSKVSDE